MRKIITQNDLQQAYDLPQEVQETIAYIVKMLDINYGTERDSDSDGGYVVLLENTDDMALLEEELGIDLESDATPEYVETIPTSTGKTFTNTLILFNNECGITILMPLEITPDNLKEYIVD